MAVQRHLFLIVVGVLLVTLASSCSDATQATQSAPSGPRFNAPGNILISDQFNNRIVEMDHSGHIVWTFGSGKPTLCNPGPGTIIGLNDAERLSGGLTLAAGTGIPAGSASLPKGCVDNRVIIVDQQGKIVWQYGQAGVSGSGANEFKCARLCHPAT